jgi:D-alanine-D-alanine ligase
MSDCGTVLILFNAPDSGASSFAESNEGVLDEVRAVAAALTKLGVPYQEIGLRSLKGLPPALSLNPARIAINLVEGFQDFPSDMFLVPAVCRAHGIEVTGNDTPGFALSTDKVRTKAILSGAGLRCPAGVVVPVGQDVPFAQLPHGLCIVKPAASDASEGIDAHCVVDSSSPQLPDLVREIHRQFDQPAIIEKMIGQREINVSILQTGKELKVLPLAEIDFSGFGPDRPRIVGYAAKWKKDSFEYVNTQRTFRSDLSPDLRRSIIDLSLRAWHALGCRDYARVDFRLTEQNEPVILEVNVNPDISPDTGYATALEQARIPYEDFVHAILDNAAVRAANMEGSASALPRQSRLVRRSSGSEGGSSALQNTAESGVKTPAQTPAIRHATAHDREAVLALVNQPKFFRPDELEVAKEVFDDAIKGGAQGHYQSFVIEDHGQIAGWICYGPTPCTLGTFDIYWIAVVADRQGRGLGKLLMQFVEKEIGKRGGRLAVIETAGRSDYESTRKFYEQLGYCEAARVRDFYSPGDDKIISVKAFTLLAGRT